MSTPRSHPTEPVVDSGAIARTYGVLRELAASDHALSHTRGQVSASLAALLATTARHHHQVPAEVTHRVLDVVRAVDTATGRRH